MKTDVELQADVLDELTWEPSVDAADIGVIVRDGIVTLTGNVRDYAQKHAAELAARQVAGVRGVAEEIEVQIPALAERTDADIARAAANALEWNTAVPLKATQVTVQKGWLTLDGTVDWQYQRMAAETAVRMLMGVRGITNGILVRPRISPMQIKGKIEAAFRRNADLEAHRVTVEIKEGKAILHGRLRSWSERNQAERAAWSAPGVTNVDNHITVGP